MLLESVKLVNEILKCNDRIIGLDYGRKFIGIAISDGTRTIANPVCVFQKEPGKNLNKLLFELIKDNGVKLIVIGMPISLDGRSNIMCKAVKDFQVSLSKNFAKYVLSQEKLEDGSVCSNKFIMSIIDIPIIFWDERFSSLASQKSLKEMKIIKSRRNDYIDKIAAALILQSFLDYINHNFV